MPSSSSTSGVAGIIAGLLAVSAMISLATGDYTIWLPVLLAIFVGLKTVGNFRR